MLTLGLVAAKYVVSSALAVSDTVAVVANGTAQPARANVLALRDRRDTVIATLSERFANDILDVDELDRRVTLAHQAETLAELDELIQDLAPTTSTTLVPTAHDAALAAWPEQRTMRAVMGGFAKQGRWTVAKQLTATCFWGGGTLDFREAQFAPGVTELRVTAIMGGLEIIVPPWLSVACDATAIMGAFEELERGRGALDLGRAQLRITGFALMGGVSIETRLPGESRRQAKQRIENETLASGEQKLLK